MDGDPRARPPEPIRRAIASVRVEVVANGAPRSYEGLMRSFDLSAAPTSALVELLKTCGFDVPAGLPEEIARRGREAIAPLEMLVYDDALWEAPDPPSYMAPFHALLLLGAIGDVACAPALIDAVKTHDDIGDFVTEDAPSILAALDPGAIPLLAAALFDPSLDTYQRCAFGVGLYGIGARHPEHRAEVAALFVRVLRDRDEELVSLMMDEAARIDDAAVQAAIDQVFAEERVDELVLAQDDVERFRAEPRWGLPRHLWDPLSYFHSGKLSLMKKSASAAQQREAKARKIGRNDPCPCGSGKKYKKCCLV